MKLGVQGLPVIQAPGEAEAMLGALQQAGLADLCATGDGDVLLLGGEAVVGSLKLSVGPRALVAKLCGLQGLCFAATAAWWEGRGCAPWGGSGVAVDLRFSSRSMWGPCWGGSKAFCSLSCREEKSGLAMHECAAPAKNPNPHVCALMWTSATSAC